MPSGEVHRFVESNTLPEKAAPVRSLAGYAQAAAGLYGGDLPERAAPVRSLAEPRGWFPC